MLQPWYRFPEDRKVDDGDPLTPPPAHGDDNPDIEDYMGHFELTGAYIWHKMEFTGLLRHNFSTGYGAVEVGLSVPLWGRLRGYTQYFAGYGESMIDYNYYNRRIGVGILFSDLL
jgi:phospholipase A1